VVSSGANFAPTIFERDDDAEGVKKAAFSRAMGRLLKDNRIHIEPVGPPSKRRAKLTPGPDLARKPAAEEGEK
jgi:hypothetical protein